MNSYYQTNGVCKQSKGQPFQSFFYVCCKRLADYYLSYLRRIKISVQSKCIAFRHISGFIDRLDRDLICLLFRNGNFIIIQLKDHGISRTLFYYSHRLVCIIGSIMQHLFFCAVYFYFNISDVLFINGTRNSYYLVGIIPQFSIYHLRIRSINN